MPKYDAIVIGAGHNGLTTAAYLALPPNERVTPDGYDVGDDNSSDMPLLILRAHVLIVVPSAIDFNGSTHACWWPAHYLVRPQLLTRL